MKRQWIYIIIGLMALSFIGLAVIQYRYFQNSIVLKEAQFRYSVDMAMNQVSQELQRYEAEQRMLSDARGRKALERLDSMQHVMTQGWSQQRGFYTKDTVILSDDGALKMSYSTYQSRGSPSVNGMRHRPQVSMVYDDRWLEDMVMELFGQDILMHEVRPLDFATLDSIATQTFANLGIDTDLRVALFNGHNEPRLFNREEGIDPLMDLSSSEHRRRLAPMNIVGDAEYLHVHFPGQRRFIMSAIWPLIFSSSSLMLIILGAFAFTIYTIFRQKKDSEIKNDFINNMTHELKTPVSTISLACEALSDPDMRSAPGASDRYVKMIREENRRLGTLVERVLNSAVAQDGGMDIKREEASLHRIILDAVATMRLALEKQAGDIHLDLRSDHPHQFIDPVHIQNVMDNLLDNALKYSPEAPVLSVRTYDKDGQVVIEVSDQGKGISKEDQRRIFETLYRVPTGDTHDVKGFGLGLSYVRSVIASHGGEIRVQSKLGQGTTFTITLPPYDG